MADVKQIAIITTVGCPYCKKAKQALRRLNLPFTEIELSTDLKTLRMVKEVTKQATVPQVGVVMLEAQCNEARKRQN